ncbi:MAG: UDP-N-acetylmuramate--alanine ligase [Pseudonocardiales bacterium]|nr:UDP-N-acetylmuramate--alanine ligase [Pseudonocardiales bacterium]
MDEAGARFSAHGRRWRTMTPRTTPTEPVELADRVHLIGIGGAGMSGIARILLARGVAVSGSDAKDSRAVLSLRALGARIEIGHDAAHLPEAPATVVVSTAIRATNPELVAARERGIPVAHRAQALAALTRGRRLAAVTGTAGKTSTTSMLTVALQHCGLDPSFAIGGDLATSGSGAHEGTGEIFVAEADESDASFLAFSPEVAIVTNVEADHLDHYGTAEAYVAAFGTFLDRIVPGGALVACADDPGSAELARVAEQRGIRVRRYGRAEGVDARLVEFRPDGPGARIVLEQGGVEHRLRLGVPGEHMALNALAALLAGVELGAPPAQLLEGLSAFDGVRRRFEFRGRVAGVAVYDDYAHHPTKVAAQLRAARDVVGPGRVVVAFQPHLYSRTRDFAADFGAALGLADEVVVLDVYAAREDPEPGVSGALVADAVTLPAEHVHYVPRWSDVPAVVAGLARSGDLVITMGAGDITVLAPEILLELEKAEQEPGPDAVQRGRAQEGTAQEGTAQGGTLR